ncbi:MULTISPECIES: type II toxin-antitoxin system VapC family toxin [unclassified Synechococcus]|uniref:type II toxin-antitoxin system VapC family toxin n=1 Tax=Synechococcales TaxID=1890424 RepID=UPI001C892635|nr:MULTISPECIES: hypothetical protein [unclassified Synechococcus]
MPHSLAQILCSHKDLGRFRGVCGKAERDLRATGSQPRSGLSTDAILALIPREAAFLAARAHAAYSSRGGPRQMILPDFLIGAHAVNERFGLLTRDAHRYRQTFPGLQLITPARS